MPKEIDFELVKAILEQHAKGIVANHIATETGESRASVYRVITEARKKGVFRTVADTARFIDLNENRGMSGELINKFPQLGTAIVIDVRKPLGEAKTGSFEDGILQRALGFRSAKLLDSIARNGDLIGVGEGGAAMEGFMDELQQMGGVRGEGIMLLPLRSPAELRVSVQGIDNGSLHLPPQRAYPKIVVAGGLSHVDMIRDALDKRNITHLITDSYAARGLLAS
ncbi:MAG TPA: hypothetical protein VG917_03695 [Patescibacteria group bacterium]|nr:hypothetical protein [Patescibacteria group bacterium]